MIILLFPDVSTAKVNKINCGSYKSTIFKISTEINHVLKKRSKEKLLKEMWKHTFHER